MPMRLTNRMATMGVLLLCAVLFLGWRFVRPMNIFVVSEAFERPLDTSHVPAPLENLRAAECAVCHREFYLEWQTSMHGQAWTDPYFQADWQFEGSRQICRNCHTPLDRQQPQTVLGFRDRDKWEPLLAPNPQFDTDLQHEGVTCTACHLRDGKIVGVFGDTEAPHPVKKIADSNEMCLRCHVVDGKRWDTFFRIPPCGTVAEIRGSQRSAGETRGTVLGCVECHMPLIERPLVAGGSARAVRMHLWRGGHDPAMVRKGLSVTFDEMPRARHGQRSFTLTLTNIGAAHHLPTGTPDRHLTVAIRLLDEKDTLLRGAEHVLKRTIMWRPFIVDLRDQRLRRGAPRTYRFEYAEDDHPGAVAIEVSVRYHLLAEARRKQIGYENTEPIAYEVYRTRVALNRGAAGPPAALGAGGKSDE